MFACCRNDPTSYLDSEGTFALLATVEEKFGMNMEDTKISAADVDLGATIYDDNKHGKSGEAMKASYLAFSPGIAIFDVVVYLKD